MNEESWPSNRICLLDADTELRSTPDIVRDVLTLAVVIARTPIWEKARARLRLRRISMSEQRSFVSVDEFHPDAYTQSRTAGCTLNAAIVHADIARSCEEISIDLRRV